MDDKVPGVGELLSFAEAEIGGEAMVRRWQRQAPDRPLPFMHSDAAWPDLARAAWEAIIQHRRALTNTKDMERG